MFEPDGISARLDIVIVQCPPALPVYAAQFFCIWRCPFRSSEADTGVPEHNEKIRASARAEAEIVVVSLSFKIVSPYVFFFWWHVQPRTLEMQAVVAPSEGHCGTLGPPSQWRGR